MAKKALYLTYIVQCSDGTYYSGITTDMEHRLLQHNGIRKGGAKYTLARKPVKLIYYEEYDTIQMAMRRERELKKLQRWEKEQVIQNFKGKLP